MDNFHALSTAAPPRPVPPLIRAIRRILFGIAFFYILFALVWFSLNVLTGDRFWPIALLNNFTYFLVGLLAPAILWLMTYRIRGLNVVGSVLIIILITLAAPYILPKRVTTYPGTPLRVATVNMYVYNTNSTAVENWIRNSKADVVFLQEAIPEYAVSGIQALRDIYPHQFKQDVTMSNLILSRYALDDQENIDLLQGTNTAQFIQQRAVITLGGKQVALYNMHLNVPLRDQPRFGVRLPVLSSLLIYDSAVRDRQLAALKTRLEAEQLPFVVGGDFNLSSQSPSYIRFATEFRDAWIEAGQGLGFTWMSTGSIPFQRLDYIYHSTTLGAAHAEVGPIIGSDHRPVLVDLTLIDLSISTPP